ncbi:MAG: glycosyltransferase [Fusobacteriaceae bacterium]
MKILHIITSMELGGAEKLLSELVLIQKQLGHEVKVFQLYNKEDMFKIDSKTSKYNSKKNILNVFEILKEIKLENYEIVHTHLLHAQFFTAIASFFDFVKRKYITTEHSTSNKRRMSNIFKYLDKFIFSRYSEIICISEGVKESLVAWLEIKNKNKFSVVPNGVDIDKFKNANHLKKEGFFKKENDNILLVMIARLDRAKDHETLIEALQLLPKKYKLILAGDGEKKEELKILVQNKKLENRVIFLGAWDKIPELLKTCDIVVQSSNFEGFGIVAVEAMAAGVPVIASDVPGLREVVQNGGVLFKKGDSKELAKKIIELEDYEVKQEIVIRQNLKVQNYSLKKTAKEYLKIYTGDKKC